MTIFKKQETIQHVGKITCLPGIQVFPGGKQKNTATLVEVQPQTNREETHYVPTLHGLLDNHARGQGKGKERKEGLSHCAGTHTPGSHCPPAVTPSSSYK